MTNGARSKLLAIGGAHIDRRGQLTVDFVPGASNPGRMREEVGGGVFNAVRSSVQRGAVVSLLSVRGGDAAGDQVALAIANAGVADLSATFLDRSTPSYTALLGRDGDVIAALADMDLYDIAFPKQMRRSKVREAIAGCDALFCDANLPAAALTTLTGLAAARPIFAIAISPAKAVRLTSVVGRFACLFMNGREAAALAKMESDATTGAVIDGLRRLGLKRGVISQGSEPVIGFDGEGSFAIAPPEPRHILDVTGAGDALAGVAAVALLDRLSFRDAVRHGMAAALLAIESRSSVPMFSKAEFAEALALVPDAVEVA